MESDDNGNLIALIFVCTVIYTIFIKGEVALARSAVQRGGMDRKGWIIYCRLHNHKIDFKKKGRWQVGLRIIIKVNGSVLVTAGKLTDLT